MNHTWAFQITAAERREDQQTPSDQKVSTKTIPFFKNDLKGKPAFGAVCFWQAFFTRPLFPKTRGCCQVELQEPNVAVSGSSKGSWRLGDGLPMGQKRGQLVGCPFLCGVSQKLGSFWVVFVCPCCFLSHTPAQTKCMP